MQEPSEKALKRDPVICRDDTLAGIRQWYTPFAQHLFDSGFYCHPFWCFRRDHGGPWGFTCGADPDDDLPQRMLMPINCMKQPLYRLLMQKDMFPRDSNIPTLIESCNGDGYEALKTIIFKAHPVFHEQPATFITFYPSQRHLTLHKYYGLFKDYLQLRAFIQNYDSDLDNDREIDVFLKNSRYAEFLNQVTRDERRGGHMNHKYRGKQLMETLNAYLMAADSPMMLEQMAAAKGLAKSPPTKAPTGKPFLPKKAPTATPAAFVGTDAETRVSFPVHHLNLDSTATDDSGDDPFSDLIEDMYDIEVPLDDDAIAMYHHYGACIHMIKNDVNRASLQPCIVCGGDHQFSDCRVLKNTEFLKQHYIRYCQQIRREATARAFEDPSSKIPVKDSKKKGILKKPTLASNPKPPASAPAPAATNFVDFQVDDDDDFDGDLDFQSGRI